VGLIFEWLLPAGTIESYQDGGTRSASQGVYDFFKESVLEMAAQDNPLLVQG
jgi:hypothetical protein